MGNENMFDEYYEFKGYRFIINRTDGKPPTIFSMSEVDFNNKTELVNWLIFLSKTNQDIPYAVWKDLFNISEYEYIGLQKAINIKTQYVEILNKIKYIDIYK